MFEKQYALVWQELGKGRKMVLSTSLNDKVTSRMMSIIIMDEKLYFQTDKTFRKYKQIIANPHIALCMDNIQIEGICSEAGSPSENEQFLDIYKMCFPGSYGRYSLIEDERLFVVTPTFIERWRYIDGEPYMELFDISNRQYNLQKYEKAWH